jgi:hypothetical protein
MFGLRGQKVGTTGARSSMEETGNLANYGVYGVQQNRLTITSPPLHLNVRLLLICGVRRKIKRFF